MTTSIITSGNVVTMPLTYYCISGNLAFHATDRIFFKTRHYKLYSSYMAYPVRAILCTNQVCVLNYDNYNNY